MNEKDDLVYLGHIIDAINGIKEYTNGMKKEGFLKDRKTQDAVIREITIIGEATAFISDLFKEKHSNIPWTEMKGTRNRIVHGYFSIDLNIVWQLIIRDLPELEIKLKELAKEDK